jgi:glycosyltransferase involved in cell wall biosynthesis
MLSEKRKLDRTRSISRILRLTRITNGSRGKVEPDAANDSATLANEVQKSEEELNNDILVFANGDESCGIRKYADALANQLNVKARDQRVCSSIRTDLFGRGRSFSHPPAIFNFELITSIVQPIQSIKFFLNAAIGRLCRRSQLTIVHSVFTSESLLSRHATVSVILLGYQRLVLLILAKLSLIVVQTKSAAADLQQAGINAMFVPHGMFAPYNLDGASGVRTSWGFSSNDIVIGIAGHPYEFKGYAKMLSKLSTLTETDLHAIKFVLIGGEPARDIREWEQILEALKRLPIGSAHVTGLLSDQEFLGALCAVDVAALPYSNRSQGSGVLATFGALGVPCLVSRSEVFDEAVLSGAAKVLDFDRASGTDIVDAVLGMDVLTMRQRMNALAKEMSIEATAQQLRAVLEESTR